MPAPIAAYWNVMGPTFSIYVSMYSTNFSEQNPASILGNEVDLGGGGCMGRSRSAQIFQQSENHLKIICARGVIYSKFHTDDPQILGATVQNLGLAPRDLCTDGTVQGKISDCD
jgi:hypothetical protein